MIGQPEIIVRRKIQECPAVYCDTRTLWRIHAAQSTQQMLPANGVEALLKFGVKRSHQFSLRGKIQDLPAKYLNRSGINLARPAIAH